MEIIIYFPEKLNIISKDFIVMEFRSSFITSGKKYLSLYKKTYYEYYIFTLYNLSLQFNSILMYKIPCCFFGLVFLRLLRVEPFAADALAVSVHLVANSVRRRFFAAPLITPIRGAPPVPTDGGPPGFQGGHPSTT